MTLGGWYLVGLILLCLISYLYYESKRENKQK